MGSGASHLKYVKEVIREEESSVEDVKEAFEKLPPDAMAELRACCRAMDELEVCFQPSENKHSSTSPAKQKRPTKPASSAPEAASYSLEKRKDLARFLDEADIRLVRAEYLWHLVESKKKAPARRQEAEKVGFTLDGSRYGCHVDKDEVEQWGAGEVEALVCSVSHCWESKEHADPTGYQIKVLASAAALYAAAYGHSVWLFLDFLSLHQFKRTSEEQEANFRKARANMHILYAHECTITLRIENLAPDSSWDSGKVCVYQKGDDGVKDLRPQRLDRNSTEYRQRGWCQSELSWSCMRSTMPSCHQVDSHLNPGESVNLHVAEAPQEFLHRMREEQIEFTHRQDSDLGFARVWLWERLIVSASTPSLSLSNILQTWNHWCSMTLLVARRRRRSCAQCLKGCPKTTAWRKRCCYPLTLKARNIWRQPGISLGNHQSASLKSCQNSLMVCMISMATSSRNSSQKGRAHSGQSRRFLNW